MVNDGMLWIIVFLASHVVLDVVLLILHWRHRRAVRGELTEIWHQTAEMQDRAEAAETHAKENAKDARLSYEATLRLVGPHDINDERPPQSGATGA